jgi:pimeloyl-ACP methyl ester carboxylesterase
MSKNLYPVIYLLAILTFASACKMENTPYGNNEKAGKYYNIRGVKMYCEVYGTGKPMLMIHGNNGSISTFKYNIPDFLDDYKVIIADARGQGKSLDKKDSLTFEMMADDYAALLDSLDIDSADVVGWSDGGISGLLLAMRHPDKVKKLAVSGANLWADTTAIVVSDWDDDVRIYETLRQKRIKNTEEIRKMKMLNLDLTEPHIILKALNKIKCPTLVICGDRDMIKLGHTQLIFENLPQAQLWVIPNSSHYTLMEHRRIFDLRIDNFFSNSFKLANINLLRFYDEQ